MDALAEFLRADAARPFRFGERDCLLRLADWGLALTGIDAAAPWRGRCSSALGAARILKREGGLVAVLGKAFQPLGYVRAAEPRRGDLAVVETSVGLSGAIVAAATGELDAAGRPVAIASLAQAGALRLARLPVVAAWTLGA